MEYSPADVYPTLFKHISKWIYQLTPKVTAKIPHCTRVTPSPAMPLHSVPDRSSPVCVKSHWLTRRQQQHVNICACDNNRAATSAPPCRRLPFRRMLSVCLNQSGREQRQETPQQKEVGRKERRREMLMEGRQSWYRGTSLSFLLLAQAMQITRYFARFVPTMQLVLIILWLFWCWSLFSFRHVLIVK